MQKTKDPKQKDAKNAIKSFNANNDPKTKFKELLTKKETKLMQKTATV